MVQWRQLNFFNSLPVQDAETSSLPGPAIFSTTSQGSVITAGNGHVFVGDQSGTLHALDKRFVSVATVVAYTHGRIDHVLVCPNDLILTIGLEEGGEALLKAWELRSSKSAKRAFRHLSSVVIQNTQPHPITCLAAMDDLTHVAIGLSDGRVVLIKGDLARDRGAKQRTVYEGEEPITALELLVSNVATTLYIFSTSKLLTLTIANAVGRTVTQVPHVMESVGAAVGCVTKDKNKNEIAVVRQDAIYFYGVQGRGPYYALDGTKNSLSMHNKYSVVIQAPNSTTSGSMKVLGRLGIPDAMDDAARITILQTSHKFIAHAGYFPQGLRKVFSEWDTLHLLTADGRLFRLEEIHMSEKLEILYSKNMYPLALSIAEEAATPVEQVNRIRIRYGDYLYTAGEYENSVQQYIAAIQQCETSTIMRKFLQAQHVPFLAQFLEALHSSGLSNADYTTLLLNCYAKLKMKDKLIQFIKDEAEHPIDLDIAVALCRQAGYIDPAIELTAKHKSHAICLGLMIEDKKDYVSALKYIHKLKDAGDVGSMLNQFGRELMSELADETTKLLIDFYTGTFVPRAEFHASGIMSPPRRVTTGYGSAFYDSMINSRYTQVLPSLPSLDMSQLNPMRRVTSMTASITTKEPLLAESSDVQADETSGSTSYTVPAARTAFPIFADYITHFIQFLEAILERQAQSKDDAERRDVVSTLLEAYLRQARLRPDARAHWQDKAKEIARTEEAFLESSDAILLFHLSSFEEGSILIREKTGRKEDVFRSYCTAKDTKRVIEALHRHGEAEPQLYILALKYFISSPKIVLEAGAELGKVLDKIQEKQLLAPLQVIQAMSSNAVANVGVVRGYLSSIIEKERREISTNQSLIDSYRKEALAKEAEATELAQNAMVLQVSRCARCGGTLELPVVHFLCKHSFHSRCIANTADNMECPICQETNNAVHAVVQSKAELAEKQDFLRESLANSRDKANFLFAKMDLNMQQSVS